MNKILGVLIVALVFGGAALGMATMQQGDTIDPNSDSIGIDPIAEPHAQEWKCSEWSLCEGGSQSRTCEAVPSILPIEPTESPETERSCAVYNNYQIERVYGGGHSGLEADEVQQLIDAKECVTPEQLEAVHQRIDRLEAKLTRSEPMALNNDDMTLAIRAIRTGQAQTDFDLTCYPDGQCTIIN